EPPQPPAAWLLQKNPCQLRLLSLAGFMAYSIRVVKARTLWVKIGKSRYEQMCFGFRPKQTACGRARRSRPGKSVYSLDFSDDEWQALVRENRKARHLRTPCCNSPLMLKRSRRGTPFFAI